MEIHYIGAPPPLPPPSQVNYNYVYIYAKCIIPIILNCPLTVFHLYLKGPCSEGSGR